MVSVGTVYADVLPDMSKFGAALNAQATAAGTQFGSSFSAGLSRAGGGLSRVGKSLTRFVTLPLAGLGYVATKTALNFEDAFTQIDALVGASDKQLKQYRSTVLDLAGETAQAPQALADALYFITSSGFSGAQALDVLKQSAQAASAGLGDVSTIADAVTSAVNAFGAETLSASDATDVLVATVREGKGEADALAGAIGRVIPISSELGVSFQDTGAAIASLTLGGLDAAEATTALRGILISLIKPTEQGKVQLEKMGTSVQDLRRQIQTEGLLATLLDLKDAFGQNKQAMGDVFENSRALVGFLNLTGEAADKNTKIFAELNDSVGGAGDAFDTAAEKAGFKFRRALAELQTAGIELGSKLIPIITRDVIPAISAAVDWFRKLDPATVSLGIKLAGLALVAGPLLRFSGGLLKVVGALTKFTGVAGSAAGAAGALNPVMIAIGGALGGVAAIIYDHNRLLKEAAQNTENLTAFARANTDVMRDMAPAYAIVAGEVARVFGANTLKATGEYAGALLKVVAETHDLVAEQLAGIPAAKAWADNIENGSNLSQEQKVNLANAVQALDVYGVALTENQKWTIQALISTGRYSQAIEILQSRLKNAVQNAQKYGEATNKNAKAAADADLAQRQLAASTKATGDSAGESERQVHDYTAELNNIPRSKVTKIILDTSAAQAQLDRFIGLNSGRTIPIGTRIVGGELLPSGGPAEHGAFIPGAMAGGFVNQDQVIRVGEKRKAEMILPLSDPAGIAALTKALERAGAGGGGGRLHVIEGRVDLNTGAMRVIAREEDDDNAAFRRTLGRMVPA